MNKKPTSNNNTIVKQVVKQEKKRRNREQLFEDLLKWLSKYELPHTIYEASQKSGLDFNTLRRNYKLLGLVAKYKVLPLPIEGLENHYVAEKIKVERPKIR